MVHLRISFDEVGSYCKMGRHAKRSLDVGWELFAKRLQIRHEMEKFVKALEEAGISF